MASSTTFRSRRAEERGRPSPRALVLAIPAWAWLTGLVVLSAGLRYGLGRRIVAPWIMVDELIYSELAKSFAASGEFLIRDAPTGAYGYLYPALISPAFAIFDSVPDAYAAAKTINALVMSLAAVPAYLLARRVLPAGLSLLAALLCVAVPSMVYTGTLMTENAFYPVFLLVALALVTYLERPTPARTVLLLALVLLAFYTRTQAVALVPAVLTAPLLLAVLGRRSLRPYRLLYALAGAALVAFVALQLARGRTFSSALGAYQSVSDQSYPAEVAARWFLYHVAELDLYLGVVPFAALLLLAGLARTLAPPVQALVAATLALTFWLLLVVGTFASLPSVARIQERNSFYVAPLFLIALLVWIDLGAPRPPRATAIAAIVSAALPGVLPFIVLIREPVVSDTLALLPLWWLQDTVIHLNQVGAAVVALSALAAALFVLLPRRLALVLPALVGAYFVVVGVAVSNSRHGHHNASIGSLFAGISNSERNWIDRRVGHDARVALLVSNIHPYGVWENEFFNRSVRTIYNLGPVGPGGLPETSLTVDKRTGLLRLPSGRAARERYVLTDGSVTLAGAVLARDRGKGLLLYRVRGPLRSTTEVTGLYPNDTWSGRTASYTRRACRGGTVTVLLESDPGLFSGPQTVRARVSGRVVARAQVPRSAPRRLRVPLRPRGGRCRVEFEVARVAVPAIVTAGVNTDPRELGVHFTTFDYRP